MNKYRKDNTDIQKLTPGERLGLAISDLKLSQTSLASECGVSPQYVNNILRRNQRITQDFAQQLAGKIGLNLNWLFVGKGPVFHEEYAVQKKDEKHQLDPAQRLLREAAIKLHEAAESLTQTS